MYICIYASITYITYMYVSKYMRTNLCMYYVLCMCVCVYICLPISYDFVAIFSLQALTDSSYVTGMQSLLAGRNGTVKLHFQELDSLKM